MNKILILLCFIFSISSSASDDFKVKVHVINKDIKLNEIKGKNYEVSRPKGEKKRFISAPEVRSLLMNAEISTKGMDQLAMDRLVYRVKRYPANKVHTLYPKIDKKKIFKLKGMLSE